jgi:hypothetical protein
LYRRVARRWPSATGSVMICGSRNQRDLNEEIDSWMYASRGVGVVVRMRRTSFWGLLVERGGRNEGELEGRIP